MPQITGMNTLINHSLKFFFRKLFYSLIVLLGVITIVFFLFNVMPADPAKMMLGNRDNKEQIELINSKFYFDKPLHTQYLYYLNDLSPISFHKSPPEFKKYKEIFSFKSSVIVFKYPYLRTSFHHKNMTVQSIIINSLPNTIVLAVSSIILALLISVPMGILCALYKDKFLDKFISIVSIMGMSLPSFLSAILISYIFAFKFGWFTNLNVTGSLYIMNDDGSSNFLEIKNLILPTITLSIRPLGVLTQLTRNSLLDEIKSNYIFLARSKGLSMFSSIIFHALRNSLSSVVTASSGWFAGMLSGTVFIEYIFGWNGIGKLIVDSLIYLDFPLVMGIILLIATFFIIINILLDLVYTFLDPRVKIN